MDGHERQPLSDDALDREITAALAVDPSPEYVARIRERVAAEVPGRGLGSRLPAWAGAVALAVVVVTAGFWMRGFVLTPEHRVAVSAPTGRPLQAVPEPPATRAGDASATGAATSRGVAAAPRPNRVGFSVRTAEVQISEDDAIALRQLVDAINARRVDASAVPDLGSPSSPLPALDAIVVDQIAVGPLVTLDAQ